jgi:peptidoglycan/LPS O-acetylase OafA/YrhL
MGIIRFLLACSVVIAHAHQSISIPILNAGACVENFFIISGFYMALVLETKYHSDKRAFWLNRWFRIAPTYYIILLFSLGIYFAASLWKHHPIDRLNFFVTAFHDQAWGALALGTLPQISIVGLQWPLLQVFTPGAGLSWLGLSTMSETSIMMERFLFVPQAWSVGVELMFYLLVPFLNKLSTKKLLVIALASFALKIYLRFSLSGGLLSKYDQVLLPPQLCLFILGMLACRYRHAILSVVPKIWGPFALTLWVLCFTIFGLFSFNPTETLFLMFSACILPTLFDWSKSLALDRWIGDLSYPIYMSHIALRWLLLGTGAKAYQGCSPWILLAITIPVAIGISYLVEGPIDRWRHRTYPPSSEKVRSRS